MSKHVTFITNTDDESNLGRWEVYIFEDDIYFDEIEPLTNFLTSFSYAKFPNKD